MASDSAYMESDTSWILQPPSELNVDRILDFLDSLEKERNNTIASRNLRLTAIRSFYRMVALRDPAGVEAATRVLAIPLKRADTKVRSYLTREEMDAILAVLDRNQWYGRRNYALLLTMYNTGARVSEISCVWRIDTVAVKRSDPRSVLRLRTQTSNDFIRSFCRR
jgi:site-specific recombinase XerD